MNARSNRALLSQHVLKRGIERRYLILLSASLVVLLAASVWSLYRWYFAYSRFGPAIVWRWSATPLMLSLVSLVVAVYSGLFLVRNRQRRILTTPEALWLINGGNQRTVAWTEIFSIRSAVARYRWSKSDHGSHLRISLATKDGNTIRIPTFMTDLDVLQQVVKRQIYPSAMDRYREMMKSGQPLEFGPLQLTRTSVTYRRRSEKWQSFRQVKLENGRLTIEFHRSKGKRQISVPARKIPNIDLCVQLLKNIEY